MQCKEIEKNNRMVKTRGEGNGKPLQYSRLENSMDRGTWWATVRGVARVGHDLATKPQRSLQEN